MKKNIIAKKDSNGEYHFSKHDISFEEVQELFNLKKFLVEKLQNKRFAIYGKLESGRYLKSIYKLELNACVIITAYEIEDVMIKQAIDSYNDDD